MNKSIEKIRFDWNLIELLIDKLSKQLQPYLNKFDNIYGIPRGGLIPGVLLSHKINKPISPFFLSDKTLIIDDICDSGKTLSEYKNNLTCVLIHKPNTSFFTPNFYGYEHKETNWIQFPWENKNSKQIQDYKLKK